MLVVVVMVVDVVVVGGGVGGVGGVVAAVLTASGVSCAHPTVDRARAPAPPPPPPPLLPILRATRSPLANLLPSLRRKTG